MNYTTQELVNIKEGLKFLNIENNNELINNLIDDLFEKTTSTIFVKDITVINELNESKLKIETLEKEVDNKSQKIDYQKFEIKRLTNKIQELEKGETTASLLAIFEKHELGGLIGEVVRKELDKGLIVKSDKKFKQSWLSSNR